MKKFLKVAFVAILAIAVAAPAMAEIKVNGYYRTIMQADNVEGLGAKDYPTASQIDNRLRAKITNQLNDNVSWVYYGEVDTKWGQDTGGKLHADGVQLQTKNVYLTVKIPNSIFSANVGVQGFSTGFDGFLIFDDAAGINANLAISDTFGLTLLYSKFDEGDKNKADDVDFYSAIAKLKIADAAKLNLSLTVADDNADDAQLYWLGAEYMGKIGGIGLNAWAMYNGGTFDIDLPTEGDVSGYAASVQGVFGPAAVRLTYASGNDVTSTSNDTDEFVYDIGGAYFFYNENLTIFYSDKYYANLGATNVVKNGNGFMALTAKYDTKLGGDMYLKLGAGYFQSAEDNLAGDADMGYEVDARIGTMVAEKVDVSLIGAYAGLGDYFGTNTDDIFKVQFMLNVGF